MLFETPKVPYPKNMDPDHLGRVKSVVQDWQIRTAIEKALLSFEDIEITSKEIWSRGLLSLLEVKISLPIELPSISSAGLSSLGNNNRELNYFAYDVYDVLNSIYGRERWEPNWFIALYIGMEGQGADVARLGLFSQVNNETVVE